MVLGMYDRLNRAETGGFLVKRKNRATGRRKKKEPEAAPSSAEGAGEDGTEGAAPPADGALNPEAAAEEVAGESNSCPLMSWATNAIMCIFFILSPEIPISSKHRPKPRLPLCALFKCNARPLTLSCRGIWRECRRQGGCPGPRPGPPCGPPGKRLRRRRGRRGWGGEREAFVEHQLADALQGRRISPRLKALAYDP